VKDARRAITYAYATGPKPYANAAAGTVAA
jgi:hypothetical protein